MESSKENENSESPEVKMAHELPELKCPLCGKALTDEEKIRAYEELDKKVAEKYKIKFEQEKKENERKSKEQNEKHQIEFNNIRDNYNNQLKDLKKSFDDFSLQRQKELERTLEQHSSQYLQEIYEKDIQLQELQKEKANFKAQAIQAAQKSAQIDIEIAQQQGREKDILIQRFKNEIDELKRKLNVTQPELKGEAGEVDLLKLLTDAFKPKGDQFDTQKRGKATADIIQKVRTSTGLAEMPIVYDNKSVISITSRDIEKAINYKKIHNTNYVFIVSRNIPKYIKNRLFGEREGIFIIHPDIVEAVAGQFRDVIIEKSKLSKSQQGRDSKESKIYSYITSESFSRQLEHIAEIKKKLEEDQDQEEKNHRCRWESRKKIYNQLLEIYFQISTGTQTITQGQLILDRHVVQQTRDFLDIDNGNGKGNHS